jgi:hypothetical protein
VFFSWKERQMTENIDRTRSDGPLEADTDAPSQGGSGGGTIARDVGTRDEEKSVLGADPEPTRVEKKDKVQPDTNTRSDHEGAQTG